MKQNEGIGSYGAIALIVTIISVKALISTPSLYVKHSFSAGWLEVLISGIFELFMLAIVLKFMLSYDKMDLIDISEHAFGKIGKLLCGTIAVIVFTISSAAVFRSFCEMVRGTIIRGLSYETMSAFLLAGGIIAAYFGIRTQINVNSLIMPVMVITVIIILVINYSRISLSNIQPVLGAGVPKIMSNALLKNASFYELGIILFLIPYLGDKRTVKKISFIALGGSVLLISIITLLYQLSVPYEAAGTFALPMYQMTRMIKAGTFFQRIEPLNIFLWGGAMLVYVSLGIWLSAHVFKKTFSVSNHRPLVFILGIVVCLLALIPGSETSVENIYDFLMTYSYIAYPLLPLGLLILAAVFKPRKNGA